MILPDKEQFSFKECEIAGDKCWLITPNHINVDWTEDNKWFRSIIIRQEDHHIVSVGFPKFVDYLVQPEFSPWDEFWPIDGRLKKDGSLIICSYYKGQFVLRTRGVTDVFSQETGEEVYRLLETYPGIKNTIRNKNISMLFEHTGPSRIIVLLEDTIPTLTLLGAVEHDTLTLWSQNQLDAFGKEHEIARPRKYTFNSITECLAEVSMWTDKEGVVLYSPDGQTLKRVKSDDYKRKHRLATGLTSFEHVVDVFLASPRVGLKRHFFEYVEKTLSWEIATKLEHHIERVVDCYLKFVIVQTRIDTYLKENNVYNYESRKDQAMEVINIAKNLWEKTIGFLLLDGNPVEDKLLKKILITINETL